MVETWSGQKRCATMGTGEVESPSRSADETPQAAHVSMMNAEKNPDTIQVEYHGNLNPKRV